MPELPEVETIVSDLNIKVTNKVIESIQVNLPKIVKNNPPRADASGKDNFVDFLVGNKIEKIERRGKLIIFYFTKNHRHSRPSGRARGRESLFLLVHLKMTGQLIYKHNDSVIAGGHSQDKTLDDLPNKYSHVVFNFKNGVQLIYNDLRQFGYLKLVNKKELDIALAKFGPEPLEKDFTLKSFRIIIGKSKRNVKAFLLDQAMIAGIGNIYADEILFASGVMPTRTVNTLTDAGVKAIHSNTKRILKKAVKYRGTTFNNYRDADGKQGSFFNMLKVYGRDGKKCFVCDTVIEKTKVAGRGTRYCKKCQR